MDGVLLKTISIRTDVLKIRGQKLVVEFLAAQHLARERLAPDF